MWLVKFFENDKAELFAAAQDVRNEWVLSVKGKETPRQLHRRHGADWDHLLGDW